MNLEAALIISDEVKGNSLIGEATINLIFNREEVTLNALLIQLEIMAEKEADDRKVRLIKEVRQWLQNYLNLGNHPVEKSNWLETALSDSGENNSSLPTHLFSAFKNDE